MDIKALEDNAYEGYRQVGQYILGFTISPERMMADIRSISDLDWRSVRYGVADESKKIPNDKRGIYAFSVSWNNDVLPPHGYILYIGIAGRRSRRSLRARYRDYLSESKISERPRIVRMIGTWHHILNFLYAPVADDFPSEKLEELEKDLNTALLPPFSVRDARKTSRDMRGRFL